MKTLEILYWLPRILGVIIILFLSIFAFDVFEPGKSLAYYAVALFMHLIPNFILAILLVIAWKRELIGGILFVLLSLGFTIFFRTYQEINSFLVISLPVFIIGCLFLLQKRVEVRSK